MARIEIDQFPVATSFNTTDVFHLKVFNAGDFRVPFSELQQGLVLDIIATNTQAAAGTSDTVLMTPAKTQFFYDSNIATTVQAQEGTDNTVIITPLRLSEYNQAQAPYLETRKNEISGTANLVAGESYVAIDSGTFTLPNVTGFVGNETVTIVKRADAEPTVQRQGTTEQIRINGTVLDTSFIFDINSVIEVIWNASTNEWEV